MEFVRPLLGGSVPLPLFRDHMDQYRPFFLFCRCQHRNQRFNIMPVYRPEIFDTKMLKHGFRHHQVFNANLDTVNGLQKICAPIQPAEPVFHIMFQPVVGFPCTQLVQVLGHGAHIFGNRHFIIVQDDNDTPFGVPHMVQGFKGHASGHGTVPDNGYYMVTFTLQVTGCRHPICSRNRRRRMTDTECVTLAFLPFRETGQTFIFPKRRKILLPPG